MKSKTVRWGAINLLAIFVVVLVMQAVPVFAQDDANDRAKIEEQYQWNLKDLYSSKEAWLKDKKRIAKRFASISEFKGKLGSSAESLFNGLATRFDIEKEFIHLFLYAFLLSDQDTRNSEAMAMKQEMGQMGTELDKLSAFIDPEILAISEEKMMAFYKTEPKLETYRHVIEDVQRQRAHTLDEAQESIIAEAGRMSGTAQDNFSILSNADLPYPTVKLSDGKEVRLDAAGYSLNRANPNREDRVKVFNSFFGILNNYSRTFGSQLYGEIKKNLFYKNVRKYDSSLERSLDRNNIPTSVYHKLVENTNKYLPTFHRYLQLRKRMLGVDELHYYDMYAPTVKNVDLSYTYDEAQEIIKKGLAPLGSEYITTVAKAFKDRWIDIYPNTGKRSGAYSAGDAYDVHPYILMNYNGQYDDVSTLAHELGHTMHSYFSNKTQPYHIADYPTFLAEVASTGNEALLIDYMLKSIDSQEEKLALLGNLLDGYKGTLFRQVQFAEFELKVHELAEQGEALTGDRFSEIYLEILKKYYGHDKGIMNVEDQFAIEWAYIPHFYMNFYVFQYSTSFLAAQALGEKMLSGDQAMIDKYLAFLSSGGSDYAIPTLKKVGIDMTTDEPFDLAMKKMNKIMDDMEKILSDLGR
ncbi:MAG: oligoendopeptidase F [Calditrichales bacterium]|nr:MAG: oligoendopeptidase F [Calditrichales bacterium]